jgi:hypothetical protein
MLFIITLLSINQKIGVEKSTCTKLLNQFMSYFESIFSSNSLTYKVMNEKGS